MKLLLVAGFGQVDQAIHSRYYYYLYSAYTLLVLSILCSYAVLVFAQSNWSGGLFNRNVSFFLAQALGIIQTIASALTIAYASRKGRFQKLVRLWNGYRLDDFVSRTAKKMIHRRAVLVLCCFVLIFLFSTSVGIFQSIYGVSDQLVSDFGKKSFNIGTKFFKVLAVILLSIAWLTPLYIFFIICVHVSCCWRGLKDRLKKASDIKEFGETLDFTIEKFNELSEVVSKINSLFGCYALAMFSTNILTLVAILYSFSLIEEMTSMDNMSIVYGFAINAVMMSILASACPVHHEAEKVGEAIDRKFKVFYLKQRKLKEKSNTISEIITREDSILSYAPLVENLRSQKVAISPMHVFTITKRFFVVIISVIFSYYVTLVQFVYGGSSCSRDSENTTSFV